MNRWLVLVVSLLLVSAAAHGQAQTPVDVANQATTGLLQQGVLGTFCILELAGIWVLYRQTLTQGKTHADATAAQNAKFVELAVQVSSVLAENNAVLRRNEELLEKALDRAALPRAREREGGEREVVGVYRGTRP